jgi:O-antigen ligase
VINNLQVYSKLLMLLMLVSTLSDPQWRQRAWWGFIAGMTLVLTSTYANVLIDLPWSRTQNQGFGVDHSVFIEYVSQSVMTAVFLALTIQRALTAKDRWASIVWSLFALIALGSVVFLLQGRSGLVAAATVVTVLAAMHTPPTRRWQAVLILIIAGFLLVIASPLMMGRVLEAYDNIVGYKAFDGTSLGLRIDMWRLALQSFVEHPFIGTGNGTYHQIAAAHFGHCEYTCTHPHNQYLFFAMEYGVLGLTAFLWLLWALATTAHRSRRPERSILFAITIVLAMDSLFNAPLWYRGQSYFFYAMLGLLIASNLPAQTDGKSQRLSADNLMKS